MAKKAKKQQKQPWKTNSKAAKLCRAADRHGVSPSFASQDTKILKKAKLKKGEMTETVVAEAERISHKWNEFLKQRVEKQNGVWGRKQLYRDSARPKPQKNSRKKVNKRDAAGKRSQSRSVSTSKSAATAKRETTGSGAQSQETRKKRTKVDHDARKKQIVEVLQAADKPLPGPEIRKRMGGIAAIRRNLDELMKEGVITYEKGERGAKIWSLL